MARQTIEVAPLAYMRGRTLSNAFVILDEAQNTTTEQMFMLLTRIGPNSKCVVTGDVTQIDLPTNKRSGLVEALQALKNVHRNFVCLFQRNATSCGTNLSAPLSTPISIIALPRIAAGHGNNACSISSNATSWSNAASPPGKTRRRRAPNELLRKLEYAPYIKVSHLHRFHRRTRLSDFQRATAGADEEFRHRAALFRHRNDATLDQSAQDLFAQLAAASGFRRHLRSARRDQGIARSLQQRNRYLSQAGNGGLIAPYALAPLVLSVLLGRNHGLVCGRICQSVGQHSCSAESMRRCLFAD